MKGSVLHYRPFRQRVCRMLRWVSQRLLEGIRQVVSGSWLFIVKVFLGLGFPLLAIRYLVKGHSGRRKSGEDEENSTSDKSVSRKDETPSEAVPAPVPEPEHKSPCALEEEEEWNSTEWRVSPADDYFCEYDSTWDTDDDQEHNNQDPSQPSQGESGESEEDNHEESPQRFRHDFSHSYKYERFQSAARDLQNYRHDYPIKPLQRWYFKASEDRNEYPNLDFYLGKRPSLPDNLYINDFHTLWRGNYDTLESVHSYIQWLFPLQEPGVNPEASTLTKQEIEEFRQNDTARKHLLESYKLMLDFYGMELCDEKSGKVKRASNWKNRFSNLNRRTHNNLRITRILKCLGTLGFADYQAPLVHFFLEETLVNRELPQVKDSVLNYFLFAVLDKKQRRSLLKFAYLNSDESEEFVWCPKKIQMKWSSLKASKQPEEDIYDHYL